MSVAVSPRIRSRTCHCGAVFSYPIGSGNDRKHCSPACRHLHRKALARIRAETLPMCKTAGCPCRATRIGAAMCEACYCYERRSKRPASDRLKPAKDRRFIDARGYVLVYRPEHPLAGHKGLAYEHRVMLYDAVGDGPHPCYWCGEMLQWEHIVVDHANEQKGDNRLDNLIIACNRCNRARGAMLSFVRAMRPEAMDRFFHLCSEQNKGVAC